MNLLVPLIIIFKKIPLQRPALIYGFVRLNKVIFSFKGSIIVVLCLLAVVKYKSVCLTFLTHGLRVCARASCRRDVANGTRSLARSLDVSIPVNFLSILGF